MCLFIDFIVRKLTKFFTEIKKRRGSKAPSIHIECQIRLLVVGGPTENILDIRVTNLHVTREWKILVLAALELLVVSLDVLNSEFVLGSAISCEEIVSGNRDSVVET